MCGICGIFNLNGEPVSPAILRKMTDAIAHRGPDGEGFYVESFIGLGHRRLAILDLSPAGHQPMLSPDGQYILTYNGEILLFECSKEFNIPIKYDECFFKFCDEFANFNLFFHKPVCLFAGYSPDEADSHAPFQQDPEKKLSIFLHPHQQYLLERQ